jgi:hypothetical protein
MFFGIVRVWLSASSHTMLIRNVIFNNSAMSSSIIQLRRCFMTGQGNSSMSCISCSPGSYNTGPAQTSCLLCPGGKYNPSNTQTHCIDCPAGKYSQTIGASSSSACLLCPAGKVSSVQGAAHKSVCQFCSTDQQASSDRTRCGACQDWTSRYNQDVQTCVSCLISGSTIIREYVIKMFEGDMNMNIYPGCPFLAKTLSEPHGTLTVPSYLNIAANLSFGSILHSIITIDIPQASRIIATVSVNVNHSDQISMRFVPSNDSQKEWTQPAVTGAPQNWTVVTDAGNPIFQVKIQNLPSYRDVVGRTAAGVAHLYSDNPLTIQWSSDCKVRYFHVLLHCS